MTLSALVIILESQKDLVFSWSECRSLRQEDCNKSFKLGMVCEITFWPLQILENIKLDVLYQIWTCPRNAVKVATL